MSQTIPVRYKPRFSDQQRTVPQPTAPVATLRKQLAYLPKALHLVWQAAPGWTVALVALLAIQGVLPVLTVFLTRRLVDSLVAVIPYRGDVTSLQPVITTILFMALALLVGEGLRIGSRHLRNTLAEQVQDWMNTLVHQQAIALDLHFYESPDYYDQLHRASIDAINRPMALLETLGALLQNTITLLAMAGVLLLFAWWMPLVLLLGTLPALVVALREALCPEQRIWDLLGAQWDAIKHREDVLKECLKDVPDGMRKQANSGFLGALRSGKMSVPPVRTPVRAAPQCCIG